MFKSNKLRSVLVCLLVVSVSAQANDTKSMKTIPLDKTEKRLDETEQKQALNQEKVDALAFYGAHFATSTLLQNLFEQLRNIINSPHVHDPSGLLDSVCLCAAIYSTYHLPEWTDTHVLGIKRKRFFLRKVLSLFLRSGQFSIKIGNVVSIPWGNIVDSFFSPSYDSVKKITFESR